MKICLPFVLLLGCVLPQQILAQSPVPTVTREMGDVGGKLFDQVPDPGRTREYFIAAEPELWDYVPTSPSSMCGGALPPYVDDSNRRVVKMRYVQYTDASFTTKCLPVPQLGILGPVLRGVVGDYLKVTFLNRTSQPLSMHPHGVRYDKNNEGSCHPVAAGKGSAIAPDARFTYVWKLDEGSGPMPGEPSSKAWLYHSHVTGDEEVNLGLVGFIIVTDPERARTDGTPRDVDREMSALFMIFDESGLGQDAIEAAEYAGKDGPQAAQRSWAEVQQMLEAGSRFAINGRTFGSLEGMEMNEGERVRWYLFGLGSEDDFHTAHWHGLTVIDEGRRCTDVVELLPASMKVADMRADNPGTWLMHCHVSEHMKEGMWATYTIHDKSQPSAARASAFFGVASQKSSLAVDQCEILPGDELRLHGRVSVFEGFAVFKQEVIFKVAGKAFAFRPDVSGSVHNGSGSFCAVNLNRQGVVQGQVMEFEARLKGATMIVRPGDVEMVLQMGTATHKASAVVPRP